MSLEIELPFPHNYVCAARNELSPTTDVRYFPPGLRAGNDGVLLDVHPNAGARWTGLFAAGNVGVQLARVVAMPHPDKLCVCANGAGYITNAAAPESWENVRAMPVVDVRAVPRAGLVIFASYTELFGYDRDGLKWQTKRLAWDGFEIVDIDDRKLTGKYWEIRDEAMAEFEVDLLDGATRGGVDP